jgi:uncharacterized membrane protein YeaQ/YmgE (transglycosylase-associated protein family)
VQAFKRILTYMLVGAVLGAVAASFLVPPILGWYNEPGKIAHGGNDVQTLCNVPELIHYATHRLLIGQLVGAGIGAVLFLLLGLTLRRSGSAPPSPAVAQVPVP